MDLSFTSLHAQTVLYSSWITTFLLLPPVWFPFTFEFCLDLLVRSCRTSINCFCLISCAWVWSISLEEMIPENNQLSWTPFPSRIVSHGISPSRSLKRPKPSLLKSRIVILHCVILLYTLIFLLWKQNTLEKMDLMLVPGQVYGTKLIISPFIVQDPSVLRSVIHLQSSYPSSS